MPDLNKQTLVNLLIDSPLREPIKINLIDIVNNTKDGDLSKTYSTIQKELEIYQKATNRRIKLADEINKKLGDSPMQQTQNDKNTNPPVSNEPSTTSPTPEPAPSDAPSLETSAPKIDKPVADQKGPDLPPPTKLPPVNDDAPDAPSTKPDPIQTPTPPSPAQDQTTPPAPILSSPKDHSPPPPPTTPSTPTNDGALGDVSEDEQALAEIQKELDTLKNSAAEDAGTTETPQPVESTPQPETKPQE